MSLTKPHIGSLRMAETRLVENIGVLSMAGAKQFSDTFALGALKNLE